MYGADRMADGNECAKKNFFRKMVKFQSEFQFARLNSGTELTHL